MIILLEIAQTLSQIAIAVAAVMSARYYINHSKGELGDDEIV